ncbi:peptide MFS transporter [Oleisolibacter albus]|uniref:peptide MFS transporter n=1 Tax=Oleisolibacter albus TaxID=2171757 RepID=UPI000DF19EE1|nr:peptide MFS transporter [Oleisolibacter albus]
MALISSDPERGFFGHPRGLAPLFFAEMWERFSFYGMRALLTLYLVKHFLYSDEQAGFIYASYASLNYAMPVIGGLIADRFLGNRKAVMLGAILLVCGHIGMAFEGSPAQIVDGVIVRQSPYDQIMFLSLAFIIVGVGFLKSNISTMVGKLYSDKNDPRRDPGYTIFYMGVNLGSFFSTIACGYLGETYGWAYGFGLAGIGMIAGLFAFSRGTKWYRNAEPPNPALLKQRTAIGLPREWLIYLGAVAAVGVNWQLVQLHAVVGSLLLVIVATALAGVLWFSFTQCSKIERDRMFVVLVLTALSVVFWTLFEQAGTSLTLFADRNSDRSLFGLIIPASVVQVFNPMFIVLLGPVFSWGWVKLAQKGLEPPTPLKFALAILQVGLGFGALVFGASLAGEDAQTGLFWLALGYLLHTTGELCLSPVGLSMISRLSVARVTAMMMGVWFLASAGAHFLAGIVAAMASTSSEPGRVMSAQESLPVYSGVFYDLFIAATIIAVLVAVISPFLTRKMHMGKEANLGAEPERKVQASAE